MVYPCLSKLLDSAWGAVVIQTQQNDTCFGYVAYEPLKTPDINLILS